ncbi:ABC-type antimicrobial peptide transport system, permease component [Dyadobacter soli]|uniref:ABC-type antimicrobial peptide transport system, permease component n=1 Tax=Dyadobacter soli TaxID=659014 RepID=A0A1G7HMK0_9BACT|nr:ABC transporter permease [Dyadobacter soli]SDF01239.1 ABC-type antimicrobial peptide transport system, permease component [Dyadobacter soli]
MIRNYLKIALRNLLKSAGYSAINIGGLSVGMAVAVLIGLWIYDEVSFDHYHQNHKRIGQVWQFVQFGPEKSAYDVVPLPLAVEMKDKYPDFEAVSKSAFRDMIISNGDKKFSKTGRYVQPSFTKMMSVRMVSGSDNLQDVNSILLSESFSRALFGDTNPVNRIVKLNSDRDVKVAGVFEDIPQNSTFREVQVLAPWELYVAVDKSLRGADTNWDENSYQIYVQLREGADFATASAKIKDSRMKRENPPGYKPEFFLHPMDKWHLYSDFENGVNVGGLISFVWLFGTIGVFVLLLACINFMNLSTARSEKRAKEVGIRKAIGSVRAQLVSQFFSESVMVVMIAFVLALVLAGVALPAFNEVSGKKIALPIANPLFWIVGIVFSLLTAVIAGSYPALYLSSFQPLKVLKGTFKAGQLAVLPRKVLVVMQFTVSVTLIIGTVVVFRQIQHAKNRPVGYSRHGLIEVNMTSPALYGHYNTLKNDLMNTGVVSGYSQSTGSITSHYGGVTNLSWPGKAPDAIPLLMSNSISHDFGKTVGWEITQGRDFSREYATDSVAMIINESALELMALKKPLETILIWGGKEYRVIGVTKDMVRESPFSTISPAFYVVNYRNTNMINIRISHSAAMSDALEKVGAVFKKYDPGSPFSYQFVDARYAQKFADEERIGKLASFFTVLAIFISCLGLFGLASFVAEQRTKEIGIRKVLGASVVNLWKLLSTDFLLLVIVACIISGPIAWYFMSDWLKTYSYRTEISWWIFAGTSLGALLITLLTVSFQAIRAALINPVKSLKAE